MAKRYTLQFFLLAALLVVLALSSACSTDSNDEAPVAEEGYFTSRQASGSYTKATLESLAQMMSVALTAKYDVDAYRVEYYTPAKGGGLTLCSGALLVPRTTDSLAGVVAWQHGTIFAESETGREAIPMAAMASLGYVVAGNFYVGFGASTGSVQPYHVPQYAASDCLSLLKACKRYSSEASLALRNELRIVGYSQGAYNAVAIQKTWEQDGVTLFKLKDVFAGDGALMLSALAGAAFANDSFSSSSFLPPFIQGYNHYYGLGLSYSSIYQPGYVSSIDSYYNGTKNATQIQALLPAKLSELFTATLIDDVKNKRGTLYNKLKENNLDNFTPQAKLHIFHSPADEVVPDTIGKQAYSYYSSLGGNVEFTSSTGNKAHADSYFDFLSFVLGKVK